MWIGRKLGEKENKRNLSEKKSRENKDGERIERKKKIRKGRNKIEREHEKWKIK